MAFFGEYPELVPDKHVWTNEESGDAGVATVTFEECDKKTLLVMTELYPTNRRR